MFWMRKTGKQIILKPLNCAERIERFINGHPDEWLNVIDAEIASTQSVFRTQELLKGANLHEVAEMMQIRRNMGYNLETDAIANAAGIATRLQVRHNMIAYIGAHPTDWLIVTGFAPLPHDETEQRAIRRRLADFGLMELLEVIVYREDMQIVDETVVEEPQEIER